MCECYKIGGPWIDVDPECPEHGYEAQRRREEAETRSGDIEARLAYLEEALAIALSKIERLEIKNRVR